jgi:hypothetical protein
VENTNILKWNERLNIAVDAANGNVLFMAKKILVSCNVYPSYIAFSVNFQEWIICTMDVNHLLSIEI